MFYGTEESHNGDQTPGTSSNTSNITSTNPLSSEVDISDDVPNHIDPEGPYKGWKDPRHDVQRTTTEDLRMSSGCSVHAANTRLCLGLFIILMFFTSFLLFQELNIIKLLLDTSLYVNYVFIFICNCLFLILVQFLFIRRFNKKKFVFLNNFNITKTDFIFFINSCCRGDVCLGNIFNFSNIT